MDPAKNWSLHAIAGAYVLGLIPHAYYIAKMKAASGGQSSNIIPRQNFDSFKGRIPVETWDRLWRAKGAHLNSFEGFPLFATAMIAGNLAKLPSSELNTLAAEYIGVRLLYMAFYMGVRSEAASYLRTGAWVWSISIPIRCLIRAGNIL